MAFTDLARMIVADGHGGTVLIVPAIEGNWVGSLNPFVYRFERPNTAIRDAIRQNIAKNSSVNQLLMEAEEKAGETNVTDFANRLVVAMAQRPPQFGKSVREIASLARVDGALVMTRDLEVLGFGAKIAVDRNAGLRVYILQRDDDPGKEPEAQPFDAVGGTRHQSAAQFVDAHRDAAALVISEDGPMSLMYWDDWKQGVFVERNAEWLL